MHQMCVVGYDGSRGPAGRFYILNSWGAAAHPAPLADEPPGGFWVEAADMDYITRQGDSWAYSDFDGFPAQQLTIDVFASTVPFTR
jgi:C1A family cysteine protease